MANQLTLILGGARAGKSKLCPTKAKELIELYKKELRHESS